MASQDPTFQSPTSTANLSTESTMMLSNFWSKVASEINEMNNASFKTHELPLARIKKIMKLDEDVKMISAEAPVLFAKAAEIFISELSLRAWVHTEDNKRRTLQRNDIAMAISKFDQFDFLIDIVPREELRPAKKQEENVRQTSMMADQVQYYFQLAQQATGNMAGQTTAQTTAQPTTVQTTSTPTAQPQQGQITTSAFPSQLQVQGQQVLQQPFPLQLGQGAQTVQSVAGQPQVIQVQAPAVTQQQQQQPQQQATSAATLQLQQPNAGSQLQQTTQVFQQVVTPSGEVQNIPIQLTPQQFQAIQLQLQEKQSTQPIVIQSPQTQQADNTVQFTTQAQPQQQQQQQPMFQIQQLPNGQQVYIQHTGQAGEGTDGQTDGQDTT